MLLDEPWTSHPFYIDSFFLYTHLYHITLFFFKSFTNSHVWFLCKDYIFFLHGTHPFLFSWLCYASLKVVGSLLLIMSAKETKSSKPYFVDGLIIHLVYNYIGMFMTFWIRNPYILSIVFSIMSLYLLLNLMLIAAIIFWYIFLFFLSTLQHGFFIYKKIYLYSSPSCLPLDPRFWSLFWYPKNIHYLYFTSSFDLSSLETCT